VTDIMTRYADLATVAPEEELEKALDVLQEREVNQLPVVEPDGRSTARQAVVYTAALVPLALAPTLIGMSGVFYFGAALVLTLLFLVMSVRFAMTRAVRDARRLFFSSITYLPLLWALMIIDRT